MNLDKLLSGDPKNCPAVKEDPSACDECEHFLSCFPEWDEQGEEFKKIVGEIPTIGKK